MTSAGLIEIPRHVAGTWTIDPAHSDVGFRTDFGISYNGPIPGGGVALGERVQIILEIEAVLQPAG